MSRSKQQKPEGLNQIIQVPVPQSVNVPAMELSYVRSSHVRHQIVVPTHLNPVGDDPAPAVPEEVIERVKLDLVLLVGGITVHGPSGDGPSAVAGVWMGDGQLYPEPVLVITADGSAELAALHGLFLRRIGEWIANELKQEAVYYTSHPINVSMISNFRPGDPFIVPEEASEEDIQRAIDVANRYILEALDGKSLVFVMNPWPKVGSNAKFGGSFAMVSNELIERYEPDLFNHAHKEYSSWIEQDTDITYSWVTIDGETGIGIDSHENITNMMGGSM